MNNAISVFDNPEFGSVRVINDASGDLWFVAKDVAEALGYTWAGIRNVQHIPDEWRGVESVSTPSGDQEMHVLSEQGLYFFLARSDKPAALPFQKWLAGDVLPSIRKHGGYLSPQKIEEALLNPDALIRLATDLKEERERRAALEARIVADRPKVLFADALDVSDDTISVGNLAKLLKQNGVNIGQNRLFEWMRNKGWLMSTGTDWNNPTQCGMDAGLFVILERTVNKLDGEVKIVTTTRVTGKGQRYFIDKFLTMNAASCPPPPPEAVTVHAERAM